MTHVPVSDVAVLSNLKLSSDELEKMTKQLDETVSYVDNLSELETEKVEATASPTGTKNVFFDDGKVNNRKLTPGVYKVDRII